MNAVEQAAARARAQPEHPDHHRPKAAMTLTNPSDLIVCAQPSDNDLALARFEALVQLQKPATQPWQPVTDYSFEARKAVEGSHPQLIKDVFQPSNVLDAGCGPAHLVRLLDSIGVHVEGFDRANPYQHLSHWFTLADVSDPDLLDREYGDLCRTSADLVICREVLEHLTIREIRQAVTNLCALSSKWVYVTTRFAKAPQHLLDVDLSDDLDPTHITMLNQTLLRVLFVLEGFKRRADLEQRMDWQHKGRVLVYERV